MNELKGRLKITQYGFGIILTTSNKKMMETIDVIEKKWPKNIPSGIIPGSRPMWCNSVRAFWPVNHSTTQRTSGATTMIPKGTNEMGSRPLRGSV